MGAVFRLNCSLLVLAKRPNIFHTTDLSKTLSVVNFSHIAIPNSENKDNCPKRRNNCFEQSWKNFHSGSWCSQKLKAKPESQSKAIVEGKEIPFSQLTVGQKVKQVGKDATYTGIVIAGIAVTGIMFYAIGRELFSGQSPSGIYSRAYKLCKKNEQVIDAIGEPIKGFGEMTSRGRRRFVKHAVYEMNSVKHMRMQFYLEGPMNKGTVHLEVKQDGRGKYQFLYIYVELENYPRSTIIIEDNRSMQA
jgi:import inner membrane translocase subunit TIM21